MAARRFPVLFITHSRIGDAVLSSGLVKALADEVEGARFTIVASALTAPLFAEVPALERLIVMEKKPGGAHWLDLWRKVRRQRWGLVVDLRGSPMAAVLRPMRRAVHRKSAEPAHRVIEAARLLKLDDTPPPPFLFTDAETRARAAALTQGPGPILAVGPCANWVGKSWPAERFVRVARELLGDGGPLAGGRLLVAGGPADRREAAPLLSAAPKQRVIDLVGRETLLVTHAALGRARLFIGGDSGLMHLAAAAGTPTLGLFGPSDERLYGPWGPRARAVRGPRGFEDFRRIDPRLDQEICHMMDLSVEAVARAARALLRETDTPSAAVAAAPSATPAFDLEMPENG